MEKQVGKVVHFFDRLSVAIVALTEDLNVGETIKFADEKHGTDFMQTVESLQVEHKDLRTAKAGTEVGTKTTQPVREGALVYRLS